MDKETLSNYGWIVIAVLVLVVMIALATPFGSFVSEAVQSTTKGLFDVNKSALDSTGLINIDDQEFNVPDMNHGAGENGGNAGETPVVPETPDESQPTIITFTMNSTAVGGPSVTYRAEEGMTWEEWAENREYNNCLDVSDQNLYTDNGKVYDGIWELNIDATSKIESKEYKYEDYIEPQVTLITFTIEGVTYQAEEGMTWEKWVDSAYDNDEYYHQGAAYDSSPIIKYSVLGAVRDENNENVMHTDPIIADGHYTYFEADV